MVVAARRIGDDTIAVSSSCLTGLVGDTASVSAASPGIGGSRTGYEGCRTSPSAWTKAGCAKAKWLVAGFDHANPLEILEG